MARVGDIADRKEFTVEQTTAIKRIESAVDKALRDFQSSEYRELKSLLEAIRQRTDKIRSEEHDSTINHHHTIDIGSSKVFLSMIVRGLLILGLSFIVGNQRRTISRFRDNDLKSRYIQMRGKASPADILHLREVFEFYRNSDSIKTIRRRVENEARARLNATEAACLQNQAETVKGGT